jgi:hypothetical protein
MTAISNPHNAGDSLPKVPGGATAVAPPGTFDFVTGRGTTTGGHAYAVMVWLFSYISSCSVW